MMPQSYVLGTHQTLSIHLVVAKATRLRAKHIPERVHQLPQDHTESTIINA